MGGAKNCSITSTSTFGTYELQCEYVLKGKAKWQVASMDYDFPEKEYLDRNVRMEVEVKPDAVSASFGGDH